MKSVVKFASTTEMEAARRLFPVSKPQPKHSYDDLILRKEYQSRKFTFGGGQTCIRLLPQLAGSTGWMLGIQVLSHPNGQHVHAKSLKPKGKSVFDTAYGWLRANMPHTLYSKANPKGFRLLPSNMAICWLLVEVDGIMQAKLFYGSTYDGGSAGGNCGVAHLLNKVASELSQPGGHDATHTEHGSQIVVEKTTAHGAMYPTYKMTRSSVEAPIVRYMERMEASELEAICPLHELLRRVEPEEEWELVAKVTGNEMRDEIRSATAKPQAPPSPKTSSVSLTTNESSPVSEKLPTADDTSVNASDGEWRAGE